MTEQLISESEVVALLVALAHGQGAFTEADALKVIRWAERVRIEVNVLNGVLSGSLSVCLGENGEPRFMAMPKNAGQAAE